MFWKLKMRRYKAGEKERDEGEVIGGGLHKDNGPGERQEPYKTAVWPRNPAFGFNFYLGSRSLSARGQRPGRRQTKRAAGPEVLLSWSKEFRSPPTS